VVNNNPTVFTTSGLKKLVIISHTPHQVHPIMGTVGWGPTVNEINFLAGHWTEVVHIACLTDNKAANSSLPYISKNIRFIPIPPFGGKRLIQKLGVIWLAPSIIRIVRKSVSGASHVQLRVPMGIGLFLIPFFSFQRNRKYNLWIKYANNWAQLHPPMGFRIQRFMLKKNIARCKVTINGFWSKQENHCVSFENPCLTVSQIDEGKMVAEKKVFIPPFNLVFAGRLEDAKGVSRILNALEQIPNDLINEMVFIGNGQNKDVYNKRAEKLSVRVIFTGDLPQNEVHKRFISSHFILLPTTASEGFPKVLAEAACYGCIPVATELASIGHYIENGKSGFLFHELNLDRKFANGLMDILKTPSSTLHSIALNGLDLAERFTFYRYLSNLKKKVFSYD